MEENFMELKDILEIIALCREDIENGINVNAHLDTKDLKSLIFLYDLCKKEIDENIQLKLGGQNESK